MISEPLPYIFEPSNQWLGIDGSWSAFTVKVGTPPQEFQILPATNVQETWVPLPQACTQYGPACPYLRGVPVSSRSLGFDTNHSTTWTEDGFYNLVSEENLGYDGNGLYGSDTVQLGNSTQGGPRLDHQVVAGIVDDDFWLGIFGLGPKPANFSGFNDPQPSFMRTLVDQKLIPSLSYGYTAGAKYTSFTGTLGSLTLGGYDSSRFTPNNVSFSFASDDSRSLTVGLQSIVASNTLQGDVTPLTTAIFSLIDSTVPHIWLPLSACEVFEHAFGLTYNNDTDLYLVNSSTHSRLLILNPTVTFKLGNDLTSGPTVSISLPYGAFNLEAHYPIYSSNSSNASVNYFPLRRAANDSQYTLGRTFLQEAYIIADYERSNFSVAQAILTNPLPPRHILPILSLNTTAQGLSSATGPIQSHKLSTGVIVAIGILSAVFLIIAILIAIGVYKRHQRLHPRDRQRNAKNWLKARRNSNTRRWVHELDANNSECPPMSEHPAWRDRGCSKDSKPWTWVRRQELPGSVAVRELEGGWASLASPSASKSPWERGLMELPGHEARSKRSSARTVQLRANLGALIG